MRNEYNRWLDCANAGFRKESDEAAELEDVAENEIIANDVNFGSGLDAVPEPCPAAFTELPPAESRQKANWLLLAAVFGGGFIASRLAGKKA